jgi:NDP-sugar pyrophosphorylase family protein
MFDFHARERPVATVGLFESDKPKECGVVEMDGTGTILSFVEKSANPPSRLANAGVYVGTPGLLDRIPEKRPSDFGFDVFPKMSGLLKGYVIHEYFLDVGDSNRYLRAQQDVETITF